MDEISMVSYQMLCMIDARLRQLKNHEDEFFGGINVLLFGDLLQLPPIKRSGAPVFKQPDHLQPATHLWRLFTLCELTENMRQQGDHTFIEILNALRIGELTANHFSILMHRVIENPSDEFATDKALRVYPTNQQVNNHNAAVLNLFRNKGSRIYTIKAQDQLIDATRNTDNLNLANIIPTDINKTGGLPSVLEIFVGAKYPTHNIQRGKSMVPEGQVSMRVKLQTVKTSFKSHITEIVWPQFRRTQMYETDVPSVWIDFGRDGIHVIHPKAIQFPAKFNYGTAERRMLPLILSWASTVHKMHDSTVDHAVVYLG
ncbi:ATP-dependent DNA helicase PIF1-like [Sitophilus oryzae]|uniref:ATP-dependent DNA helicase n=1 Tax=Sitophilus oryzae TaxID=7048 RepID=A0A6J2Y3G7_SITOR|nr:ATP-dependent DNA helicase PIF1-like [Sitophilus oryzae]